jgi:exonuclease VII small subunit
MRAFMMRKFASLVSLKCFLALFLMQFVFVMHANAVEQAAEDAITRAQEIVAELESGIADAEKFVLQAKETGDEQAYKAAMQSLEAAEQMLEEAKKHLASAMDMAKNFNQAPSGPVASAASYSSHAKADTSHAFARVGMLYLQAVKFAANQQIDCSEKINQVSAADKKTWQDLKKIKKLAFQSFGYAKSAFTAGDDAASESAKSEKTAKECIALANGLDLQLENFEEICDDFKKKWKKFIDQEDDEEPSPR